MLFALTVGDFTAQSVSAKSAVVDTGLKAVTEDQADSASLQARSELAATTEEEKENVAADLGAAATPLDDGDENGFSPNLDVVLDELLGGDDDDNDDDGLLGGLL